MQVRSLRNPPAVSGDAACGEVEAFKRDCLARHLLNTRDADAIEEWLKKQTRRWGNTFIADLRARVDEQAKEQLADHYLARSSHTELVEWLQSITDNDEREAWRGRLNHARERRQLKQ